jgi:hypothetical protein
LTEGGSKGRLDILQREIEKEQKLAELGAVEVDM